MLAKGGNVQCWCNARNLASMCVDCAESYRHKQQEGLKWVGTVHIEDHERRELKNRHSYDNDTRPHHCHHNRALNMVNCASWHTSLPLLHSQGDPQLTRQDMWHRVTYLSSCCMHVEHRLGKQPRQGRRKLYFTCLHFHPFESKNTILSEWHRTKVWLL